VSVTLRREARAARDSGATHAVARAGIAARGVLAAALGVLTVSVVRGAPEQTDQTGALRAIAGQPLGEGLVLVLSVGFAGYTLYLLLHAVARRDGAHRAKAVGKAIVYGALAVSTGRFLVMDEAGGEPQSLTADLLALPGGRWLVGAVGIAVVVLGGYLGVRAVTARHRAKLDIRRIPDVLRLPVLVVGTVGLLGRAVAVGLIGVFVVQAAARLDPGAAKGFDAALQAAAEQRAGQALILLAAVGFFAFALWSFAEAAWSDLARTTA
jgi:hypothetical protein